MKEKTVDFFFVACYSDQNQSFSFLSPECIHSTHCSRRRLLYLQSHRNATPHIQIQTVLLYHTLVRVWWTKTSSFSFHSILPFSQSMRPTCTCHNASCNDCGGTTRKMLIRFAVILSAHKFTIQLSSLDPLFAFLLISRINIGYSGAMT